MTTQDNARSGYFWDMIEGRSPLPPVSSLLGWKLLALDPAKGSMKVEFMATPEFANAIGTIQGGIITSMLDDAMGPAATALVGGHLMAPTVELKTNFIRPAKVGPLFVEAKVVHHGRDIVFLEGAMTDQENKLIATATATARLYKWPTTPGAPSDARQESIAQSNVFERVERDAWLDLFAAVPTDCGRRLGVSFHRIGDMGLLACREIDIVEFNRALCIGSSEPVTETQLDLARLWLQTNAAAGWALQIAPSGQTTAVRDWLNGRTLKPSGAGWAKFERAAGAEISLAQPRHDVRPVTPENAQTWGRVVQAGFDLPDATAEWFAALVGRPGWFLYLAYDGPTAIASAAAFVRNGVAWFGIDATVPAYRKRGAQLALINRRIEDGGAAGLTGFTAETGQPETSTQAAHMSYRNYQRAGFKAAYVRPNFKIS